MLRTNRSNQDQLSQHINLVKSVIPKFDVIPNLIGDVMLSKLLLQKIKPISFVVCDFIDWMQSPLIDWARASFCLHVFAGIYLIKVQFYNSTKQEFQQLSEIALHKYIEHLWENKHKILKYRSSLLIVQESTTYYTISSKPTCEAVAGGIWANYLLVSVIMIWVFTGELWTIF